MGVAAFVSCVSMVSSNAMAVILDELHMAGTASSLAGTFRFGIGAIVGALLSMATFNTAWPMLWAIALCATCSILFYLYASRPVRRRINEHLRPETGLFVDPYQPTLGSFTRCLFLLCKIYLCKKSHHCI